MRAMISRPVSDAGREGVTSRTRGRVCPSRPEFEMLRGGREEKRHGQLRSARTADQPKASFFKTQLAFFFFARTTMTVRPKDYRDEL